MPVSFSNQLLKWYEKYGRHDLPWQKNPTSYRVWISEIMLQQTQVTTVIPYYARFMQRFPDIKVLALATEDEVLSHWSGLGYYARARNIYKTAKIIHEKFHGIFPETVGALNELPGIGLSTAGAIISFSLQKKAVILDGNVRRVLTRYFAIADNVADKKTIENLWVLAKKLTPEKNANKNNQQTFYPVKIAKKARPTKKTRMLIIYNHNKEILLLKRPSKGIWGGLWSFPECALEADYTFFQEKKLKYIDELEKIIHQFTHFTLEIFPMILAVRSRVFQKLDTTESIWYKLGSALPGGIASPVAKILNSIG